MGDDRRRPIHRTIRVCALVASVLCLVACGRDGATGGETVDVADTPTQAGSGGAGPGPTLRAVRQRGRLTCGVHQGLVGFAHTDNRGVWRGFDIDFCRAMAAAIFGDAGAVRFAPLTAEQRFVALVDGRIDVLWRNTSWTLSRDTGREVIFAGINYYDGQGFLVRRSLNLASATELNGARICVQAGSTTQLNMEDYFTARGLEYRPVVARTEEEARSAYAREDCDAFSADVSALAAARTTLPNPQSHVLLPEVISKEPLGPVVRADDDQWAALTRWVLNAVVLAEELGVTRANVETQVRESRDPRVRRLLGVEPGVGAAMGLSDRWARDAIAAVGNYGEVFERNVGSQSSLDLDRGLNAQWNAASPGLIYGLPVR